MSGQFEVGDLVQVIEPSVPQFGYVGNVLKQCLCGTAAMIAIFRGEYLYRISCAPGVCFVGSSLKKIEPRKPEHQAAPADLEVTA